MGPSPLLDFFKRGDVARDVRMQAALGALAPRAYEQLSILVLLLDDPDSEIRWTAEQTLGRIPPDVLSRFLARSDVPIALREFFSDRGVFPADVPAQDADQPLIEADAAGEGEPDVEGAPREVLSDDAELASHGVVEQLQKMEFSERLKAAMKGTREMRAILIRDPNKMIAAAVLSSPKLSESEVESIARMTSVSDEILRMIGSNRAWTKNYSIVLGLAKNPKTPLAMSMNLIQRLGDRDLNQLAVDRNVPEPLRAAARKKVSTSKG